MKTLQERVAEIPYWYHRIDLGNGVGTPGWAPLVPEAYGVPERMDGETILDVGAWDGYWTFEALKRGALRATAIDDFSDTCGELLNADRSEAWQTFDLCAEALGYKPKGYFATRDPARNWTVNRFELSIEEHEIGPYYDALPWGSLEYDRVFMFGVLYHLRNPVLASQNCFDALKSGGTIHVETAIIDDVPSPYTGQLPPEGACYAEFYPTNEFGKNQSNWWVPTLKCAASWLYAVGFRDIETWKLTDEPKSLAECRGFLRARKP